MDTTGLTGTVITPLEEVAYTEARLCKNARFDIYPKLFVFCRSEDDIVNALNWAKETKTSFVCRSGGHSYEAFSLIENGMVIDLSAMNKITIASNRETIKVGPGALLGEVYKKLSPYSLTISAGSCPTVGIAGLTLGGGFGLISRMFGLACDNLISARIIDANGRTLVADSKNNSDLFWACQGGGGGNFGIVTEFEIRTHSVEEVLLYKLTWDWQDAEDVINCWQRWAPSSDERFTNLLVLEKSEAFRDQSVRTKTVTAKGQFLGSLPDLLNLLGPLQSAGRWTEIDIVKETFYNASLKLAGINKQTLKFDPSLFQFMVHKHPLYQRFKNTSDYVYESLPSEAIKLLIESFSLEASGTLVAQLDSFGGAVNRVPSDQTAFCHRDGVQFSFQYQAYWDDAVDDYENISWVRAIRQCMSPFVSGQAYVNYCDLDLINFEQAYYGLNLEKLRRIKREYDPNDVFNFAQSLKQV